MSPSDTDIERAVDYLRDTAPKHAKAKAERTYIENFLRSKKSILMKSSGESALGAQEREAYAHQDYVSLLDALRTAVEEEETLKGLMQAAQTKIDWWRSVNASNRNIDRATQ
jgi:hypothetical protein